MINMTSNKPYLIRAIYDWIVDNELSPYILVNASYPGVQVPGEYINHEGHIILNISPKACRGLHLENDRIVFTARFSGESLQIVITPAAVLAIYAKENGQGMEFCEDMENPPPPSSLSSMESKSKKPALTLVKKE